jgi:hypothetical protein
VHAGEEAEGCRRDHPCQAAFRGRDRPVPARLPVYPVPRPTRDTHCHPPRPDEAGWHGGPGGRAGTIDAARRVEVGIRPTPVSSAPRSACLSRVSYSSAPGSSGRFSHRAARSSPANRNAPRVCRDPQICSGNAPSSAGRPSASPRRAARSRGWPLRTS